MTVDPYREEIAEAHRLRLALQRAEDEFNALKEKRVEHMRLMFDHGMSWAEIGRAFDISAPAAMYATGHSKRTSKSKEDKARGRKKPPGDGQRSEQG